MNDKIGNNDMEQIKKLFKSITKTSEFEFIFFSKKEKNLTLEKYLSLLKFLSKRASIDKKIKLIGNEITLDISYNPDKETSYRCSLISKETIDKYMKKLSSANNHVIFRNLISLSAKDKNIQIMKKEKDSDKIIDIDDLYMRVRLSDELDLTSNEIANLSALDETHMNKITFRFKERTSLYVLESEKEYVKIDLTIVKTEYKYDRLNLAIPKYELEIESKSENVNTKLLEKMLLETEILFKVIQQSNFVITKTISENVINKYRILLSVPKNNENHLYSRQPVSLEIQYVESLANKYAVTDKADGEHHFLFICDDKVYLINKNLDVRDTGIVLKKEQKKFNNSVIDGELIFLKNRHIFLAFDCLFDSGIDIRKEIKLEIRLQHADNIINNCFIFEKQKGIKYDSFPISKDFNLNKHLEFHKTQIKKMFDNLNYDIDVEKQYVLIRRKYFIHALGAKPWEIYSYTSLIWNSYTNDTNIKCPYILDGVIYQPNEQAYVANARESRYADYKWKPPEKNSIDFYVEFVKDINNSVLTIYDNSYDEVSDNVNAIETANERIRNQSYKICHLHVGQTIGNIQTPVLFREQEDLYEAYLLLKDGEARDVEGNILSDKTVVEFYYNMTANTSNKFKWIPLRTRYDKTEAVMRYKKGYGNYITVADGVWKSIINPILMTDFDDLAQGNIPEKNVYLYDKKLEILRKRIGHDLIVSASKENVYFQKITLLAKPMRSFHSFIKQNMLWTFCHKMYQDNKQKSVLDFGCGRGADLMKFYYTQISFYVGLDYDKEALISPIDGAVSRYNQLKKKPGFPKMYFMQADFTNELDYENQFKSLKGMENENKLLIEKFFSKDIKSRTIFDIIHFGFSMHYAFKDDTTFANLKKNINNYLRNDGYVLITTFDALSVRKLLKGKEKFTQEYTDEKGNVQILFDIIKKYQDVDDNVIMGTGNTIDVHMAWISNEGVYLTEYLVDEQFLIEEFKRDCDLELVTSDLFENQMILHKEYLTNFIKYEADERTRKFLFDAAEFYKNNSVNNGCHLYSKMEKFYVFRKKSLDNNNNKKKQKGGDFTDIKKFVIPSMTGYNNDYSFLNSIHHIMKNHKIIPKTIYPEQFYSDMNIEFKDDLLIEENLINISKNIIVYHQNEYNKQKKVVDGLNIIVVERNCNNEYDVKSIHKNKNKKNLKDDLAVIITKEGGWYTPVYAVNELGHKNGLFNMNDPIIQEML